MQTRWLPAAAVALALALPATAHAQMEHAKAAAADMIRRLPAADRVNVVSFSDEVDPLFRAPQRLDEETRARAIRFVERLREGGGTDIALALSTAIT